LRQFIKSSERIKSVYLDFDIPDTINRCKGELLTIRIVGGENHLLRAIARSLLSKRAWAPLGVKHLWLDDNAADDLAGWDILPSGFVR